MAEILKPDATFTFSVGEVDKDKRVPINVVKHMNDTEWSITFELNREEIDDLISKLNAAKPKKRPGKKKAEIITPEAPAEVVKPLVQEPNNIKPLLPTTKILPPL